jgi:hypothetical protein
MSDEGLEAKDRAVLDFATYEDYLDSQITEQDLFYLEVGCCRRAMGRWLPLRVITLPWVGISVVDLVPRALLCGDWAGRRAVPPRAAA